MSIFFSISLAIGGVVSPYFMGGLIGDSNIDTSIRINNMFIGYITSGGLMLFASLIIYLYGIDSENKSLEDLI